MLIASFLVLFSVLYQALIKDLKTLYDDSRANSCIEHAIGVMEEEKAPENLSKKISSISLTGDNKKVLLIVIMFMRLHCLGSFCNW